MNVTAVGSGTLAVAQSVSGTGVAPGTFITGFGTGTGGIHNYAVNVSQTVSSGTLTASGAGAILNVSAWTSGALAVGQSITGTGVLAGTVISALSTGTGTTGTYLVNISQTAASTALTASGPPVMNVTAWTSGALTLGQAITGSGVATGTVVTSFGTGTGKTGTYFVSVPQTVGSTTLTASGSGGSLTVTAVASGSLAVGQSVTGSGVTPGTVIAAGGSGTGGAGVYAVSASQTVGSETLVIPSTSNQVIQTDDQGGVIQRALIYRPGGDLFQDQTTAGTLYEYDYNAAKRMTEVKQNGTQPAATPTTSRARGCGATKSLPAPRPPTFTTSRAT